MARAQLRHIRLSYERNTKVSARLASEIARVTSVAQGIWAETRANEDVAGFLPVLEKVVALRREEAAALAGTGPAYDALLNDCELGATEPGIAAMFDSLRPRLVALREKILGSSGNPRPCRGDSSPRGSCAGPAIWPGPSVATGRADGWILRCIPSPRARGRMCESPPKWWRASR